MVDIFPVAAWRASSNNDEVRSQGMENDGESMKENDNGAQKEKEKGKREKADRRKRLRAEVAREGL